MTQLSNLCHCSEALLVCSDNWGFKPARYIACMTKVIGPRGMVNGPTVVARMARCFKCVYSFEFLFATSFWPAQYMPSVFSIVLCSYVHGFWARIHVWFHARSFAFKVYNCCDRGAIIAPVKLSLHEDKGGRFRCTAWAPLLTVNLRILSCQELRSTW